VSEGPLSDEALMAAYVGGDERAFSILFRRCAPRVHAFFVRTFGSVATADDLLQQTFVKVVRARHTFRLESRLRPWLFAIAARVRLDELRHRRRLAEDLDEDSLARADEAVEARAAPLPDPAERAEVAEHVQAALALLPESQRVVVHLHRFEGLTFVEIAEVLHTTEGAVKLRAFRAYEQLRKRLAPLFRDEEAA
jgi:RNA polymerase sigma-70 factor (ECF subfamily)